MEIKIDGIKYVLTPAQLEAAAKEHEAQKNGPASQLTALIKQNGFDINPKFHPNFLPFMDGRDLCIRFPGANREWSFAIMKACMAFCHNKVDAWPSFVAESPGDILRIRT